MGVGRGANDPILEKTLHVTETKTIVTTTITDPAVDLNSPDESLRQEVRRGKEILLRPKAKIRLGAWNVRTMFETSKAAKFIWEMRRYKGPKTTWR